MNGRDALLGPAALRRSGEGQALRRFTYPDGHAGWLVTGHALARRVLSDPRFSSRAEVKRPPLPRPGAEPFLGRLTEPGWFIDMDRPEHTRFRRLLAGRFTSRALARLRPRVQRIVADRLDSVENAGRPADLVAELAVPVPLLTISEILGVPTADRDLFHRHSTVLFSLESTPAEASSAMAELTGLFLKFVRAGGNGPDGGLISDLAASGEITEQDVAGAGVLLLTAGHETVSGMLGLGTYALLGAPEQLAALRDGKVSAEAAVEELLRYIAVLHHGVPRGCLEDVEVEGQLVRAGDAVTVSLAAANHDPGRFEEPGRLALARGPRSHLAFGHGPHQCIGQNLARLELRTAFPALLARFPGLRLAVPPGEVAFTENAGLNGLHKLPVTW